MPDVQVPPTVATLVADLVAILDGAVPSAEVSDARAEAYELLAALVDGSRSWAPRNGARPLNEIEARHPALSAAARTAARKRAAGAPMQYATGSAAFRALTLLVDERVLIPRPETELLVSHVLARVAPGGIAADVGTGSGAIALALATEGEFVRVIATDVSLDALAVAGENVTRCAPMLRAPVELRAGSLCAPLRGERVRALASNPPYISWRDRDGLPALVRDWEPALALFSEDDGLAAGASIVRQAPLVLERGGILALETDARGAARLAELAVADGRYADVQLLQDLTGRDRFVVALCEEIAE